MTRYPYPLSLFSHRRICVGLCFTLVADGGLLSIVIGLSFGKHGVGSGATSTTGR